MIALARERGVAGRSVEAALALTKAAAEVWGKPLPMNVSMTIAATLRDVDVPPGLIRAVPILARTAGLIAHCIEEAETPIGFLMASKGEEAIASRRRCGRSRLMAMVEPEIEQAPWEEQARSDAPLYLKQIEYLFERSRFYREKLERAGFATHGAVGGLEAIEGAAADRKGRAERSRSPDEPIGAHRTASRRRDRAHLFDQRHDRNAELYSADRRRSRSLGAHLGALLRGLGAHARRAHRLDL